MILRNGDILKNSQLDKKYKITEFIGFGGFGEVYKATNNSREVAIKVLPSHTFLSEEETFEIVKREAEAGAKIKNENVVEIYDYGKDTVSSTNLSFIVMELLTKNDFKKIIQEFVSGKIDLLEAKKYIEQILNGVKAIHKILLHRDLKPENILISNDGKIKITDFGMSKYVEEATRSKSFKGGGTMPYMAPETWDLTSVSNATDIYSLGIIFYQFFTGDLPFTGTNDQEWRRAHLFGQIPRVIAKNNKISPKMDNIIYKMMGKDAKQRYQSIEKLEGSFQLAWDASLEMPDFISKILQQAKESEDIMKSAQLKEERKREEHLEKNRKINYKIEELVKNFDNVVNEINKHLEGEKIEIGPFGGITTPMIGSEPRTYSYKGRRVEVFFFREFMELPERLQNAGLIAAGGMFVVSRNIGMWGKNLLLIKKKDEIYGDWIITETEHSALIGRRYKYEPFAFTDSEEFIENMNYHFMHTMHVTVIKEFPYNDSKFAELIEKMIATPIDEPQKPKHGLYYNTRRKKYDDYI